MFSELISVEVGVESYDLVNGSVEGRTRHHSGEDVVDGFNVLFRQPIMVEGESGITIEDGLTDFLLAVAVVVFVSVFGHSNPP